MVTVKSIRQNSFPTYLLYIFCVILFWFINCQIVYWIVSTATTLSRKYSMLPKYLYRLIYVLSLNTTLFLIADLLYFITLLSIINKRSIAYFLSFSILLLVSTSKSLLSLNTLLSFFTKRSYHSQFTMMQIQTTRKLEAPHLSHERIEGIFSFKLWIPVGCWNYESAANERSALTEAKSKLNDLKAFEYEWRRFTKV